MKISSVNCWTKVAITMFFFGMSVLIISLVIFIIQYFSFGSKFDSKVASELGGYISGFVGVLWTGAGAIFVYATFQEQKKLLEKQQFESSFFKLLDTYNNLVDSLSSNNPNGKIGRKVFSNILENMKIEDSDNLEMWRSWVKLERFDIPEVAKNKKEFDSLNDESTDLISYIIDNKRYSKVGDRSNEYYLAKSEFFLEKNKAILEPYFRFIYNIFKYATKEIDEKKRVSRYLEILLAQMSNHELVILFYYAKMKEFKGENQLLVWLKTFNFLQEIDKCLLLNLKLSEHLKD